MADAAALDGERSEVTVDERSVFFWQYQFCSRNSLVFGELCLLEGLFQHVAAVLYLGRSVAAGIRIGALSVARGG